MIDIKLIREDTEKVKECLGKKGIPAGALDKLLELDARRREIIKDAEQLKSVRNKASQDVAKMKKDGNDASDTIAEMKKVSDDIKLKDDALAVIEKDIDNALRDIPNLPEDSVPLGKSADDNVQFRIWGEKPTSPHPLSKGEGHEPIYDFKYLDHVELGKKHDILDFGTGAKISGSGFPFYKGKGAILERALINFMLDSHKTNGYTEVYVPFLVNRESMEAAEKVPKFEEDMYRTDDDLFAIPTAEVPILNVHRDETLNLEQLPVKYCGFTACFRREAGSYGKDTKGFLRVHQFNKVELVNFCTAETSYDEMENMLNHACGILEALNIHYRVVYVCTGDMGFAASKQYDIEVWSPAENKWLEASSVSNCTDFQSRRANIRTKRDKKMEFVHILNGSGLATSRLFVALVESNQTPEGKIIIPSVLHKYTGFEVIG